MVLPLGLPDLPFHLRLDALSAFFLVLLGGAAAGISVFSAGYFRASENSSPRLLCLQYHVFLAAMALVLVADDAYLFMVAWETMALASFFLVTTDHRVPEIRRAGFLYLLIAHVGAVAILLCFGVLQGGSGDYTFGSMRSMVLAGAWPSVAFLLALAGFGAKAGLLPLHVWLPEAHPAAPSPVSALMSAVMLKTAIYGMLRVTFDLLNVQLWWWGVTALVLGLLTALFGVIYATVQTDMKRLLAYSSIENIGIIVAGIGLTILFKANAKTLLASIALAATLYHALNHAFFKSLLFLATGSVLHATRERSLGKLGGLIHRMPWVAWSALVGALAIAGLPPLNGFVSEWLLLQAFLFTPTLPQSFINMLVPLAAAALVLVAALGAYVMVKFYGVVFLGRPREAHLAYAHDAGRFERVALVWFATGCIALGLFPGTVIGVLDHVNAALIGATVSRPDSSWWLLAPINADRSSYSPLIVLLVIVAVVVLTLQIVHRYYHGRVRSGPAWDCGFPMQTPRMQDTAEGFGQPIRQVFEAFFRMERVLPSPFDAKPQYRVTLGDPVWQWLYLPIMRGVELLARFAGRIQQGRISIYLVYSFVTLLALLMFIR
jgi:formate hydrogenlyase subunit 3/multisubunit Na+/H+ antiporter MnhD subunit